MRDFIEIDVEAAVEFARQRMREHPLVRVLVDSTTGDTHIHIHGNYGLVVVNKDTRAVTKLQAEGQDRFSLTLMGLLNGGAKDLFNLYRRAFNFLVQYVEDTHGIRYNPYDYNDRSHGRSVDVEQLNKLAPRVIKLATGMMAKQCHQMMAVMIMKELDREAMSLAFKVRGPAVDTIVYNGVALAKPAWREAYERWGGFLTLWLTGAFYPSEDKLEADVTAEDIGNMAFKRFEVGVSPRTMRWLRELSPPCARLLGSRSMSHAGGGAVRTSDLVERLARAKNRKPPYTLLYSAENRASYYDGYNKIIVKAVEKAAGRPVRKFVDEEAQHVFTRYGLGWDTSPIPDLPWDDLVAQERAWSLGVINELQRRRGPRIMTAGHRVRHGGYEAVTVDSFHTLRFEYHMPTFFIERFMKNIEHGIAIFAFYQKGRFVGVGTMINRNSHDQKTRLWSQDATWLPDTVGRQHWDAIPKLVQKAAGKENEKLRRAAATQPTNAVAR